MPLVWDQSKTAALCLSSLLSWAKHWHQHHAYHFYKQPGSGSALKCKAVSWSAWNEWVPEALPCDGVMIVHIYRDRFTLTSCYPSPGVHSTALWWCGVMNLFTGTGSPLSGYLLLSQPRGPQHYRVMWCYDCIYLQGQAHPGLLLSRPRGPHSQHCRVMVFRLYLFTGTGSPWPPAIPAPGSMSTPSLSTTGRPHDTFHIDTVDHSKTSFNKIFWDPCCGTLKFGFLCKF